MKLKKRLSAVCAFLLILSTVLNCSGNEIPNFIIVGPSKSGKTSITNMLLGGGFNENFYDDKLCSSETCMTFHTIEKKLNLYDFSGDKSYMNMVKSHINKTDVMVICISVTDIINIVNCNTM
ncbi:MAG: GTPase domain-containing protein [Firmicutes bacterium]|nr:GTPase domain-containing protein [Bacillota bacterium]